MMSSLNAYVYNDKFIEDMCEMFDGERVDMTDYSRVTFKTEKLVFESLYHTKWGFRCPSDRLDEEGVYRAWRSNMHNAVVSQIVMKKLLEIRDQRDRLQDSLTNLLVPDGPVACSIVQGIEQQAEQQEVDDEKLYTDE